MRVLALKESTDKYGGDVQGKLLPYPAHHGRSLCGWLWLPFTPFCLDLGIYIRALENSSDDFPAAALGTKTPDLLQYVTTIHEGVSRIKLHSPHLISEANIEIGQMGVYRMGLRSDFNGFLSPHHVLINDSSF